MQIIYMTAEENNAPISLVSDISAPYNRFKYFTKQQIIKACWLSLQEGLDETDTIHLLTAGVSDSSKEWFTRTCKATLKIVDVPTMAEHTPPHGEHPYPQYSEIRINHFIPQYEYFINLLESSEEGEIFYYSSDDYLHLPETMTRIKGIFAEDFNMFLVPQDYPDTYNVANTEVFISNIGHFKRVFSSTPNIVATRDTWLRFKYDMLKASVFADDGWTYKAFNQVKAISPMPGWSTHLQEGCLTPLIDWEKVAIFYLNKENQ